MAHKKLFITDIVLKQLRCFTEKRLTIESPIVFLEGTNGSGKSTILEALHYACYLRSFRTHQSRDLIAFNADAFFLQINLMVDDDPHSIQIGLSHEARIIRFDKRKISSYKELINHYRVISITEHDMALVTGSPEDRRNFIDQALSLQDTDMIPLLKELRIIVSNRTQLFYTFWSAEHYSIWTDQLIKKSYIIRQKRQEYLNWLSIKVNTLGKEHISPDFNLHITYKEAGKGLTSDNSIEYDHLIHNERKLKRSLLGAHIDDYVITFANVAAKRFSSRGQQKLVVLLLKIAQLEHITVYCGPPILLLDDFFSDFDEKIQKSLADLIIHMNIQVFFVSPQRQSEQKSYLLPQSTQHINLSV